jgi:hypothetical protein
MSASDALGVIGVVAAIIGIVVAAYYGRRALNPPKRLIQWGYEATPLISDYSDSYRDAIEVRVLGEKVENPYLGKLAIENLGRHDIDSSSFDQGRPLRFVVRGAKKVVTFLRQEENAPGVRVDGDSVFVGPELLRSKSGWVISFVSDGRPEVELVDAYLINVKVRQKSGRGDQASLNSQRAAIASAVIAGLSAIIAALAGGLLNYYTQHH